MNQTLSTPALTPAQIVAELDLHIIGQKGPKRSVAIAFRDRWRRQHADPAICQEITPSNILMKGSTGTGKTEIGRRLAKIGNIPFTKVEATKYTERGYVGGDVEQMIVDLANSALHKVKAEREEQIKEKARARMEAMLLDILIPPLPSHASIDDKSLNRGTRARFLQKLRQGELDQRSIEVRIEEKSPPIVGGMIDEQTLIGIQDMFNRMMPKKKKKHKMTIANARQLLLQQEIDSMLDLDMENIKKEARARTEVGIVFIDEIDKISFAGPKTSGPDVSREGVQRNLLPIIEGCNVKTPIGPIDTTHILFIAAGAFHNSQPADLMPELQGRFPIRVEFHNLTEKDFYHILKEPKNSILKQRKALFKAENVDLHFSEQAIQAIAKAAYKLNQEREDIGARRLHTILMTILEDALFDVPDKIKPGTPITIDHQIVEEKLSTLLKQKESSRYIL